MTRATGMLFTLVVTGGCLTLPPAPDRTLTQAHPVQSALASRPPNNAPAPLQNLNSQDRAEPASRPGSATASAVEPPKSAGNPAGPVINSSPTTASNMISAASPVSAASNAVPSPTINTAGPVPNSVNSAALHSGQYSWPVSPTFPRRFNVRVLASDLAGNVAIVQSPTPLVVDAAQTTVSILSVETGS